MTLRRAVPCRAAALPRVLASRLTERVVLRRHVHVAEQVEERALADVAAGRGEGREAEKRGRVDTGSILIREPAIDNNNMIEEHGKEHGSITRCHTLFTRCYTQQELRQSVAGYHFQVMVVFDNMRNRWKKAAAWFVRWCCWHT